jgi:hypothetical protein
LYFPKLHPSPHNVKIHLNEKETIFILTLFISPMLLHKTEHPFEDGGDFLYGKKGGNVSSVPK